MIGPSILGTADQPEDASGLVLHLWGLELDWSLELVGMVTGAVGLAATLATVIVVAVTSSRSTRAMANAQSEVAKETAAAQREGDLLRHRRDQLMRSFDQIEKLLSDIDESALTATTQQEIPGLIADALIPLRNAIVGLPAGWYSTTLTDCYRLLRRAGHVGHMASSAGSLGVVLGATGAARRTIGAARREETDPGQPPVFAALVNFAHTDEHPTAGSSTPEFDMETNEVLAHYGEPSGAFTFLSAWRDRGAKRLPLDPPTE